MVIAVASLASFFQVLGEACTRASNSLVTGRGEGWGYSLFLCSMIRKSAQRFSDKVMLK
jgi:hypothetical protein